MAYCICKVGKINGRQPLHVQLVLISQLLLCDASLPPVQAYNAWSKGVQAVIFMMPNDNPPPAGRVYGEIVGGACKHPLFIVV